MHYGNFAMLRDKISDDTSIRLVSKSFDTLYSGRVGLLPYRCKYDAYKVIVCVQASDHLFIRLDVIR